VGGVSSAVPKAQAACRAEAWIRDALAVVNAGAYSPLASKWPSAPRLHGSNERFGCRRGVVVGGGPDERATGALSIGTFSAPSDPQSLWRWPLGHVLSSGRLAWGHCRRRRG
jgi:hypothetical protein